MSKQDLALIDTILTGGRSLLEGLANDDGRQDKMEFLFSIKNPDGFGSTLIGRKGQAALDELVASAIKSNGLSGQLSVRTGGQILGPLVLRKFRDERGEVNHRTLNEVFREAGMGMRAKLKTHVHLVPCHLFDSDEPRSISLGPVTFLSRSSLRGVLLKALKDRITEDERLSDRKFLAEAIRYYRGYRWVAKMTVNKCDPDLASEYAQSASMHAVSALQLMLGGRDTQGMRVGGAAEGWTTEAELRLTQSNDFSYTISRGSRSGVLVADGWSKCIEEPGFQVGLRLCGLAIEASLPGHNRPLSERVLGAFQWYGEAVRESSAHTRLVKSVTAIEHLVLTRERTGITLIMARRVAALTYRIGSQASRCEKQSRFLKLYALRSKIVHGRISPWDPIIASSLGDAFDLAEETIHGALSAWREEGLKSDRAKDKLVRDWFQLAVWSMITDTEPVSHVIDWCNHDSLSAADGS